jgi:hypothetical protein
VNLEIKALINEMINSTAKPARKEYDTIIAIKTILKIRA